MPGSRIVEVLGRPRIAVAAGLAGAVAIAWLYLVPVSRDMYGAMSGPSAWMMQAEWNGRYFALMSTDARVVSQSICSVQPLPDLM